MTFVKPIVSFILVLLVFMTMSMPLGSLPPLGDVIDPSGGIWAAGKDAAIKEKVVITNEFLNAPVKVYYDNFGVPHIYAKTDRDMYFVTGYLHAKDRLFQLDFQHRLMYGELSEVIGRDTLELDKEFRFLGIPQLAESTLLYYKTLASNGDINAQKALDELNAYTEGINAYISSIGNDLPLEMRLLNYRPRLWKPEYTIAFTYFMSWVLTLDYYDLEVQRLVDTVGERYGINTLFSELFPIDGVLQYYIVPGYGNDTYPLNTTNVQKAKIPKSFIQQIKENKRARIESTMKKILDHAKKLNILSGPMKFAFAGSNNWAIGKNKSTTGYSIHMNDMHLSWRFPGIWSEIHQYTAESDLNLFGYTLVGVPYVVSGHNQYVAWGHTNVGPDFVDMYYYTWKDDTYQEYWYKDHYEAVKQRVEKIKVRGHGTIEYIVNSTRHGPLFMTSDGEPMAVRWAAAKNLTVALAIRQFNRARNWQDFKIGLSLFDSPPQNIAYADFEGNVAITAAGHYPIRSDVSTTDTKIPPWSVTSKPLWNLIPVNGSTGKYEWVDWVDTYDEMPHAFNPEQGYVASANQKTAGPLYKHFIAAFQADGYRGRRINEFIRAKSKVSVEDMKTLQRDVVDTAARSFVKMLLEDVSAVKDSQSTDVKDAIDILANWKTYEMKKNLTAPLVWAFFRDVLLDEVFGDEWDAANATGYHYPQLVTLEYIALTNKTSKWFDDERTTDKVETRSDIFLRALIHAVNNLKKVFGDNWKTKVWGDYHFKKVPHLTESKALEVLLPDPVPADGSWTTVNVAYDVARRPGVDKVVYSTGGPSERIINDFSDLPNSLSSLPTGNSGNPFSKHWDDQYYQHHVEYGYHIQAVYNNPADLRANVKIESIWIFNP